MLADITGALQLITTSGGPLLSGQEAITTAQEGLTERDGVAAATKAW